MKYLCIYLHLYMNIGNIDIVSKSFFTCILRCTRRYSWFIAFLWYSMSTIVATLCVYPIFSISFCLIFSVKSFWKNWQLSKWIRNSKNMFYEVTVLMKKADFSVRIKIPLVKTIYVALSVWWYLYFAFIFNI